MKSQPSLSRVIGSHLSLLGMAAYTLMSGPASAFAATTTDTKTLQITANVGNYIALTQLAPPTALNLTPPPVTGSVNTANTDATYTINTNTAGGYSINIIAPFGTGSCTSVVMCIGTATPMPQTFAAFTGANAAVINAGTWATNQGLGFRVRKDSSVPTATVGYDPAKWGTDDLAANAKYAGVPQTSTQVLTTTSHTGNDAFALNFLVGVPSGQLQGAYTSSIITLSAVTNG